MKNFILSIICLSVLSSAVYAIPPVLRLSLVEVGEGIKYMARRSMSTLKATPGYRPDKEVQKVQLIRATVPSRIKYTDKEGESYISLAPFKEDDSRIMVPSLEVQDDHSVLVHLKKKP